MPEPVQIESPSLPIVHTTMTHLSAKDLIDARHSGVIAGDTDLQRWMNSKFASQVGTVTGVTLDLAMASRLNYNNAVVVSELEQKPMNYKWLKSSAPFLLIALTLLALFIAMKALPPDMARSLHTYISYFQY